MIDVQALRISFGKGIDRIQAVRGISFVVNTGESFGLVGESGSGKSTVLRAICGLNHAWQGAITIDGEKQGPKRGKPFFKKVQMVFQDPYASLHPRHTVDRILSEPVAIHGLKQADERINKTLEEVGLGTDFRFRYPHQLSGGQRQRIAIARVLILEPKVLLLDEPTSALDVSIQAEVLNLLSRLRRKRGLTYILVSHDLAVVSHMCDRVAVMNNGKIVEQLDVALINKRDPGHPYTRQLLTASLGYDRHRVDNFKDFSKNL
jgi:peptide/nickel transport system ATP-binding protein